jgi:hypothetical protein
VPTVVREESNVSHQVMKFVSFEMFKRFALENGVPGAEELTTDFLVFTGSVAGGVVNGAITQPPDVKLSNEYDYYMTEIDVSASFVNAAAAVIVAQPYVPIVESQHLAFNLAADGRTRSLFKLPIPFARILMKQTPMTLPAPAAFSGTEKVSCVVTNLGNYNPAAIAAQLDFTITCTCAIIKGQSIKDYERYLKGQR